MRQFFILLFFLNGLFFLSSCESQKEKKNEDDSKITSILIKDIRGKEIHLTKPAKRVICLFNPILDGIYMLGAGDQLVGVPLATVEDKENYDYYRLLDRSVLEHTLATPGSGSMPNVEAIVALKPDLVILYYTQEKIADKLEEIGIPVYLCVSQEWEEIIQELRDIGILMGKEKRADSLIQYAEGVLHTIKEKSASKMVKEQKSVYFTWAYGRVFTTIGHKSMMNTCLTLANARNVCTAPIYQVSVDPEMLIKWNPDAIIMWNDSPSLFYNRKEFQGINAIKNKQIYNLEPMFFYNVHNLKALCAVVRINNVLYGNNGDDMEEIRKIIATLYGKDAKQLLKLL